jgi:hypothetical protein
LYNDSDKKATRIPLFIEKNGNPLLQDCRFSAKKEKSYFFFAQHDLAVDLQAAFFAAGFLAAFFVAIGVLPC